MPTIGLLDSSAIHVRLKRKWEKRFDNVKPNGNLAGHLK